jgi:xanthine/uracil permease
VLKPLSQSWQLVFSSGISTGGLTALLLNIILPRETAP